MPIQINSKKSSKSDQSSGLDTPTDTTNSSGGPAFKAGGKAGKSGKKQEGASATKPAWLRTGADARTAMTEADAAAEKAKEESGKLFRFFIPEDEEATITFLDGDLDDEGLLNIPMMYEHRLLHAGKWSTFVCIADSEPCPMCENGDKPALVGLMTVINHTPYTIKNGPNAGNTIANRKQLFVATRQTIKKLQKIAHKRGTLRYHVYEASRTEDKSPRVGDLFERVHEWETVDELKQYLLGKGEVGADNNHPVKAEDVDDLIEPADYPAEIVYRDREELAKLGLTSSTPIGHGSGYGAGGAKSGMKNKL